jgi:hypothetical protein
MTLSEAKRRYVHRYTMEHVPAWSQTAAPNGKFYAPQYRSDKEWFEASRFPPDPICYGSDCYSSGQTWPLGQWLDAPYRRA